MGQNPPGLGNGCGVHLLAPHCCLHCSTLGQASSLHNNDWEIGDLSSLGPGMRSGPREEEALPSYWLNQVRGCNSGRHRSFAVVLTRAGSCLGEGSWPLHGHHMATAWTLLTYGVGTEFLRGRFLGLKAPKGCILYPRTSRRGLALTNVSHLWDWVNPHGARQGLWLLSTL